MTDEEKDKVTYTRPKDEGEVDKRRFAGIMGVAGTAVMIALISFFSIGMVGAAIGVGIGGFVANFENVSYNDDNAQIYPVLGAQAACDNAPQLEASLTGQATLFNGVEFFKDLPLPGNQFGDGDEFARISIVASGGSDGISVNNLDLRLTALETPNLSLTNANIKEFSPSDYDNSTGSSSLDSYVAPGQTGAVNRTPGDTGTGASQSETPEFGITANSFNLPDGGTAAAHQVSFESISLQDLDLFVQILDEGANNNPSNGSIERVVNPSERNCEALAAVSTAGDVESNGTVTGAGPQLTGS
jgi:hypothetical protein